MNGHVVLAGGSGFLGNVLADYFTQQNVPVVILSRHPRKDRDHVRYMIWDAKNSGPWVKSLENARAVVNLAGKSVDCRYNEKNRREILESRITSTRAIGEAIAGCKQPPPVWLNSSTATIYKHTFGPAWDEAGEIGGCKEAKDIFSVEVATAWEKEFNDAATPNTRKAALRTAMVLGSGDNSVFPVLMRLVRFGLGGRTGSGNQFVSWIHEEDFCRAVEWIINREDLAGPINLCAPNPLTNKDMMRTLREIRRMPFGLPATNGMLEIGTFFLRTESELVIKSRRVIPRCLLESGFQFNFSTFREAAEDLSKKGVR